MKRYLATAFASLLAVTLLGSGIAQASGLGQQSTVPLEGQSTQTTKPYTGPPPGSQVPVSQPDGSTVYVTVPDDGN